MLPRKGLNFYRNIVQGIHHFVTSEKLTGGNQCLILIVFIPVFQKIFGFLEQDSFVLGSENDPNQFKPFVIDRREYQASACGTGVARFNTGNLGVVL